MLVDGHSMNLLDWRLWAGAEIVSSRGKVDVSGKWASWNEVMFPPQWEEPLALYPIYAYVNSPKRVSFCSLVSLYSKYSTALLVLLICR